MSERGIIVSNDNRIAIYVVVVTDSDTEKRREIEFYSKDEAITFKTLAEDDGTYWGFYTKWKAPTVKDLDDIAALVKSSGGIEL